MNLFNLGKPKAGQVWVSKKPLRSTCPDMKVVIVDLKNDWYTNEPLVVFSDEEGKYVYTPIPLIHFKKLFKKQ